jgi:hypothetical protein
MLEVILGALLALAIRDLFYDVLGRYKVYKYKKETDIFYEHLEDLDDELEYSPFR